jgi:hypothetical protein
LQPEYIPVQSIIVWKNTADSFELLWNLPHWLGSADCKHILFFSKQQFWITAIKLLIFVDNIFSIL